MRQQVGLSAEHSLCSRPATPRLPQAKAARPRSSDKAAGVRHQAPATATSPSSEEAAQAGGAGQAAGSSRGSLADGLHIKLGIGNTSQPPGLGAVSLHPEMKHLTSNHLVQPGWFSQKENVSVCKEVVFFFFFSFVPIGNKVPPVLFPRSWGHGTFPKTGGESFVLLWRWRCPAQSTTTRSRKLR